MITDLAGLVNQLRTTLGKMEVALGAIADAIVWTGRDGTVQWCNAAFDRLVNRSHILVLGVKLSDLLPLTQAGQAVAPEFYPDVKVLSSEYEATKYEFHQGRSLVLEISGNCVELTDDDRSAVLVIRDVTQAKRTSAERQQAEEALRLSELKYRNIFENSQVGILRARIEDGLVLDANQRLCELAGYSHTAEVIGKLYTTDFYVNLSDRQRLLSELRQNGVVKNFELQFRQRDGSLRWGLYSIHLNAEENCLEVVINDISDLKQAQAALQQAEEKYRSIFENSQVGIGRTRQEDGLFLDVNQRFAEIMGFDSAADLIGKRFTTEFYMNPGDRQQILAALEQQSEMRNFELQLRRPDGSVFWSLLSMRLNSEESCLEFVITDISDRKQAEAALKESQERFHLAVSGTFDGVWDWDLRTNQVFFSPIWMETLGYSEGELPHESTTWFDNVYPDDLPVALKAVQDHLDGKTPIYNCVFRMKHKDGRWLWIEAKGICIRDESGKPYRMTGTQRDISERKHLEAELLQSQQFLDSVIENIPLTLFIKDIINDFRYVLINKSTETNLGFARDEAIGLNDYDLFVKEQADVYRAHDLAAVAQGTVLETSEQWIGNNSDERKLLRTWKLPLFDPQGNATHLLGIYEDVTEHKQREEALRLIVEGTASKTGDEFFRSCVRYLAEALRVRYALITEFVSEAKTRVRTLAFWGGEAGEDFEFNLQGAPCENVFLGKMCYYPENLQALFPNDPDLVAIGAQSYLGIPLTTSSGIIIGHLAVIDVKPMAHDPGRELILKIFAARAGAELERKQANAALQLRAQVESLLSSISRQFIDQDVDTAINFTLRAIAQFMGTERSRIFEYSEQQGQSYMTHEWCPADIEPLSYSTRRSSIDQYPWLYNQIVNGKSLQISQIAELPLEAAEKAALQRLFQSIAIVPMIHTGKVVGFIGTDVVSFSRTWSQEDINLLKLVGELVAIGQARHKAEEALRVAKEAAEAANRAKSAFLANMSHELRTPLNAILGFAQLMERDAALTSRQRDSLATINRSGEHLLNLINDVLEMSKIEAGRIVLNPAPFDLHRLLQSIQEMFQVRAEAKQLSLQFAITPDLPQYVLTDEGKLRQVLINLLGNAVKFTQTGGIMLRVRAERGNTSAYTLFFEVEDTGRGIALEEMDSLFQPFVQMSGTQAREGTGLGLTISRQFVQLMGGNIHLTSTVGQGSTFCFNVPVTLADASEVALPLTYRRVLKLAPDQPTYRILVVDDRQEGRDLLAQLLSSVGFETRAAANGQEAIAQWQTWHPHLIWMDMRMPVMDGYKATRQIKAQPEGQATVIVALTASAFEEQQADTLAAGCNDFVRKPFREQVILDKMAEHMRVQYVYAEEQGSKEGARPPLGMEGSRGNFNLRSSDLAAMPIEWVAALHQAAIQVDAELILQLLEQIPETHAALAEGLADLVHYFCFDEIIDLTQGDRDA